MNTEFLIYILFNYALYHIAHALDLKVDLAYFQRGNGVWDVVRPLHSNNETIIYNL